MTDFEADLVTRLTISIVMGVFLSGLVILLHFIEGDLGEQWQEIKEFSKQFFKRKRSEQEE